MKSSLKRVILLAISVLAAYSCNPKASAGVEINGVTWAVTNIETPRKFASDVTTPGMHHDYETCFVAENPCPKGWQLAGYSDFAKLTDPEKVNCAWVSAPASEEANGEQKCGLVFTDLTTGQTLFLPAAGMTDDAGECFDEDLCCFYWSTAPNPEELPAGIPSMSGGGFFLHFDSAHAGETPRPVFQFATSAPENEFSVRCVKATTSI